MGEQTTVEQNRDVYRRIVEEIFCGDLAAFDDLLAEDVVMYTPVGPMEGREAVREYVEGTFEAIPDAVTTIEDSFGSDDIVAGRFLMSGTQSGEAQAMGLPATGRRFELPGALFARFERGRCVELWSIWDKMDFLQQLGLFPDSPAAMVRLTFDQLKQRLRSRGT